MSEYDIDSKLSISRKRIRAADSTTPKRKRPDLCITTTRALLFIGEDNTSEFHMKDAISGLGTKMSNLNHPFNGKVQTAVDSLYVTTCRWSQGFCCYRLTTCWVMLVLALCFSFVSCPGTARLQIL